MRAYLIKAILRVFSLLPLPVTHLIGIIAGWLLYLTPSAIKQISSINIELCLPSLDAQSRIRLLRNSLVETAKTITELGPLWYWRKARIMALVKKVSGEEALEQALQRHQGVILAVPHLGTWEMVGLYCSAKYRMTSLYRPPRISELDTLTRTARGRFGAQLVPTDISGIRALYRALAKGELVAILPDQEPASGHGVFVPFYGIPAYTMTLLHKLTCRTNATILYTYAERLPLGKGYHLHFITPQEDIRNCEQDIALQLMNKNIEMCVNTLLEQYQWSYKRFRKRPEGVSDIY